MSRFFTETLSALVPYTPGEQLKMDNLIKINANENPYPPAPGVAAAVQGVVHNLRLYSDLKETKLVNAIAKRYGVAFDQVLCGNGSDENLTLAIRAFCDENRPLAYADITYSFYPVLCDLMHVPKHIIPIEQDWTIDLTKYYGLNETIVIANPNAPTSLLQPREAIEKVVQNNPNSIVIVDEAYIDFADDPIAASCVPLINKYDNLVVMTTFSKSRNLAGARLGITFACAELIADMNRIKFSYTPYNINSLSEAAGAAAMEDEPYFQQCCKEIRETRRYTIDSLRELGFTVLDSQTNFVFATTDKMPAAQIYETLRARGILIRYFSRPERISTWVRITIGTPQQMQALIAALKEIL